MLLTFWATFFVFYDPLDFSTGICPTPTRQKVGKTQLCALTKLYKYSLVIEIFDQKFVAQARFKPDKFQMLSLRAAYLL